MAVNMVEKAREAGLLVPGGTLEEGTSGNAGLGLAMAAAEKGWRPVAKAKTKLADVGVKRLVLSGSTHVLRAGVSDTRIRAGCVGARWRPKGAGTP